MTALRLKRTMTRVGRTQRTMKRTSKTLHQQRRVNPHQKQPQLRRLNQQPIQQVLIQKAMRIQKARLTKMNFSMMRDLQKRTSIQILSIHSSFNYKQPFAHRPPAPQQHKHTQGGQKPTGPVSGNAAAAKTKGAKRNNCNVLFIHKENLL